MLRSSWIAAQLAASQDGLRSMSEWVTSRMHGVLAPRPTQAFISWRWYLYVLIYSFEKGMMKPVHINIVRKREHRLADYHVHFLSSNKMLKLCNYNNGYAFVWVAYCRRWGQNMLFPLPGRVPLSNTQLHVCTRTLNGRCRPSVFALWYSGKDGMRAKCFITWGDAQLGSVLGNKQRPEDK
jgi:hypothetical protein